jgi:geranylgeranyl pyrophosphate synthase
MDIIHTTFEDLFWMNQIARIAGDALTIFSVAILIIKPLRKKVIAVLTRDQAARSGICALLRTQIISACKKAKANDGIYFYDRENLVDMFEQYTKLGGNHGIKALVEEITELPTLMDLKNEKELKK